MGTAATHYSPHACRTGSLAWHSCNTRTTHYSPHAAGQAVWRGTAATHGPHITHHMQQDRQFGMAQLQHTDHTLLTTCSRTGSLAWHSCNTRTTHYSPHAAGQAVWRGTAATHGPHITHHMQQDRQFGVAQLQHTDHISHLQRMKQAVYSVVDPSNNDTFRISQPLEMATPDVGTSSSKDTCPKCALWYTSSLR